MTLVAHTRDAFPSHTSLRAAQASFLTQAARTCGVLVIAGVVLLPTTAAQAASTEYGFNLREVFQGHYEQTIPVEANVSSTSVTAVGDRVDYRLSVRYGEWKAGWAFPLDAFRTSIDLSAIADDVEDIDAIFDDMTFTPVAGLKVERVGSTVNFFAEFDPEFDAFEVEFSATLASGGDGRLGMTGKVETRGRETENGERWDYGPSGTFDAPVVAAHPAPIIAKSVDRTTVTPEAPQAQYTISVQQPDGGEILNSFTLTDDLSDVLAEADGTLPTDLRVVKGGGDFTVEDGVLTGTGVYGEAGEFVLTFSTAHLGTGDGVLQNTACVQAPARSTMVQADPLVPVTSNPYDGKRKIVDVPGGSACSAAPDVVIEAPDTGTEGGNGGTPDTETPEKLEQAGPAAVHSKQQELAESGSGDPVTGPFLAGLLAVAGGVAAVAMGARRRIGVRRTR